MVFFNNYSSFFPCEEMFHIVEFINEVSTDGSRAQAIVPDVWMQFGSSGRNADASGQNDTSLAVSSSD